MSAAGATILVVEDEQELREYLVEELEDLGYRVRDAANGMLALALLHECRPDLVLTDIMMPQLGGADLYHATRREPALADLPFLFLSALSSAEMLAMLPVHERRYVLKKPIDYDDLAVAIRNRLARG